MDNAHDTKWTMYMTMIVVIKMTMMMKRRRMTTTMVTIKANFGLVTKNVHDDDDDDNNDDDNGHDDIKETEYGTSMNSTHDDDHDDDGDDEDDTDNDDKDRNYTLAQQCSAMHTMMMMIMMMMSIRLHVMMMMTHLPDEVLALMRHKSWAFKFPLHNSFAQVLIIAPLRENCHKCLLKHNI